MVGLHEEPQGSSSDKLLRISELIIEALKAMSQQRQPLTPALLSQALASKSEIADLFHKPPKSELHSDEKNASPRRKSADAAATQEVTLSRKKDSSALSLESVPVDSNGLCEFYKRSLLTMIVLASGNDNQSLEGPLRQFRSLILANQPLDELEECLRRIKHIIMMEEQEDSRKSTWQDSDSRKVGESSALSAKTRYADIGDQGVESDRFAESLRTSLLKFVRQLQFSVGDEYGEKMAELDRELKDSGDIFSLLKCVDALSIFLQDFFKQAREEQQQLTSFVKELRNNLVEMEDELISSMNQTQESHRLNSEFNQDLQNQMEGIKGSFDVSKTLLEVREFVFSKIKSIKEALNKKRQEDETRLQSVNERMLNLQKSFQSMKKEVSRIQSKTRILEQEVLLDNLTGIFNRRAYEKKIREELERYHRYRQPFSLILFDIDHFKNINDTCGHHAGDKCLKEIVSRIKPSLRQCDFLARYGGEEFAVVLVGTPAKGAFEAAEKIRQLVKGTRFQYRGKQVPVSISLGVTEATPDDLDVETIFRRADEALYKAKRSGRNQTCLL